jgi:putative drug exporter of the RND superfamily
VFVFGSFVLNGDPTIKQFGVGLAVAVILDATVVRCLLVPSVMLLMGRTNWWMPNWLDRITPPFSIEGAGFFRARDQNPAAQPIPAAEAAEG